MSYNSKLEQTGRRVASARRKYYGSFDYGSGLTARQRAGGLSFGRRYDGGGAIEQWYKDSFGDDWVFDNDELAATRAYWNEHPLDYFKVRGVDDSLISKWQEQQNNGGQRFTDSVYDNPFSDDEGAKFGGQGWWTLAGIGLNGISNFYEMNARKNAIQQRQNLFGTDVFSGLRDNNALLSAMANTGRLSDVSDKDIRNKTVGQDIMSVIKSGASAAMTGGIYAGLAAMLTDTGRIAAERIGSKYYANELTANARLKNRQFNRDMTTAAMDVDAINDWKRRMGSFNYPYEYAMGGPLHSNGGDYNGGLTFIDAGGRHEQNPYEGVLSGFDSEGNPNLVEEGEVIWNNDYVFSDRINIPKRLAEKYGLGGKKMTFADAIEKVTKENTISPNDPVTIATTKEIVNEFMDEQEAIREQRQMAAREELEAAQADDFLAQLDALRGGGMGMPPQSGGIQLPPEMGIPNEAPVTEGNMAPPGYAFGGKKFEGGGWEDFFKMLKEYKGSLGESNASGRYAIDRNAKYWNNRSAVDIQKGADYQAFTKWVKEHKDDPNVLKYFEYLDNGINKKKGAKTLLKYDSEGKVVGLADGWDKTFEHRRTDDALGIYHLNPADIGFLSRKQPVSVKVPDVALKDFDFDIPFDLDAYLASPNNDAKTDVTKKGDSQSQFKYLPTWQRDVPIYGALEDYLERKFTQPDYSNADAIIAAASRLGRPINIPVETIGDYRRRNPYDERYLVNMANQNRLAAQRAISDTAGGNRSMDLLGAMSLAHSNQADLAEIMRQAYLANRQDDAQVADFNRGTNVYNMNAINQRNLSQAQLNTHREQAGFSGLAQGYGLRQTIHDNWDDAAMDSYNSFLASVGAKGKENEEYNLLTSMAEQGYFPYYYGDRSIMQYARPTITKNGGKLNRKKRRF